MNNLVLILTVELWIILMLIVGNIIMETPYFSNYDIGVIVGGAAFGFIIYALAIIYKELKIPHVPKDE